MPFQHRFIIWSLLFNLTFPQLNKFWHRWETETYTPSGIFWSSQVLSASVDIKCQLCIFWYSDTTLGERATLARPTIPIGETNITFVNRGGGRLSPPSTPHLPNGGLHFTSIPPPRQALHKGCSPSAATLQQKMHKSQLVGEPACLIKDWHEAHDLSKHNNRLKAELNI